VSDGPVERPRGLLSRLARRRKREPVAHVARVYHVDPPVSDPNHGTYRPYWVAICDADDLQPEARDSVDEAFADARAHSQLVDPAVYRPLDAGYLPPPKGTVQWTTT
jgi:hypothetical protein